MTSTTSLPGMDPVALRSFLADSGVEVAGDLDVHLISGGRSNLTFGVTDGATKWVVRRPPTSGLTPSAHDMNREWTVTRALQGTAVPVARTVAFDAEGTVLGAPCTVVEFVEGTVIRSASELDALDDAAVDRNVDALIRTLADLHAVDHEAVGLGEFGRPEGFVARQVKTWTRQWGIVKTRELPDVEKLAGLLADNIPTDSANAIVHGDFRVDNTILDADDPGVVRAVVDWEMSTLGDPITDVALMCVYRQPIFDRVLGLSAAWTSDRYPDTDDLAQRYATAAGVEMAHWGFYLALANFKLGVIGEGIAYRALQGSSSGEGAEKAAEATQEFMAAGLRALS
ncbi:putative kinase, aminoglycoside phosphotransferase (APT) family [Williamsia serinedens]|uniref:Kinase, aminoglycoside phosphotransferase (APT) family n=2 Tax=Williamsia serinedens TaxID=391736 RepID=A0ABT1H1P6_9NOCA|nr:putative kinase, aminoglycoside phosphotransferase (APT) family [Williamsia serinedens]